VNQAFSADRRSDYSPGSAEQVVPADPQNRGDFGIQMRPNIIPI
jgi:hypothetical protein